MVRSAIREIQVTKPDTEYSKRRRDTAPVLTVEQRDTERRDDRKDERDRPTDHPLSVAASRGMLRVRVSLPLVAALAASLGAAGTTLVSYVVGLNQDKQERAAALAEIREVRAQFDAHELRIADLVRADDIETKKREESLRRIAELQLLEWQHVSEVIVALHKRSKTMPEKKIELVEAEARVQTNLRDGR